MLGSLAGILDRTSGRIYWTGSFQYEKKVGQTTEGDQQLTGGGAILEDREEGKEKAKTQSQRMT